MDDDELQPYTTAATEVVSKLVVSSMRLATLFSSFYMAPTDGCDISLDYSGTSNIDLLIERHLK